MASLDLPPYRKRAKFEPGPIEALPDHLLAKIFSYLPFKDRYLLCLVSSGWAAVSRQPWTDIASLRLNNIPAAKVYPFLRLCPRIESIRAADQTILVDGGDAASPSVRTMCLRNVSLAVRDLRSDAERSAAQLTQYFSCFPNVAELRLSEISCMDMTDVLRKPKYYGKVPRSLVDLRPLQAALLALRRLAVTGWLAGREQALQAMPALECLYLDVGSWIRQPLWQLPNLRELCLHKVCASGDIADAIEAGKMPALEVLMFASYAYAFADGLARLLAASSPLRILLIAGDDHYLADRSSHELHFLPVTLPRPQARCDVSSTAGVRPPPLQIFVGGNLTKRVRFTLPPSGVAEFWRIDRALPAYLEKAEVAAVFKGVWCAKVIREKAADNGPTTSMYERELYAATTPLLFC